MANITYRQVNDYLIPNLTLPPEESNITLGKWGILHKDYLFKHKKVVFATLLAEGKLWQYLADIEEQAQDLFSRLVKEYAEKEDLTVQVNASNQMVWVRKMNNIRERVAEVVNAEVIFV